MPVAHRRSLGSLLPRWCDAPALDPRPRDTAKLSTGTRPSRLPSLVERATSENVSSSDRYRLARLRRSCRTSPVIRVTSCGAREASAVPNRSADAASLIRPAECVRCRGFGSVPGDRQHAPARTAAVHGRSSVPGSDSESHHGTDDGARRQGNRRQHSRDPDGGYGAADRGPRWRLGRGRPVGGGDMSQAGRVGK